MTTIDSRRAARRAVAYDSLDAIVANAERLVDASATTTGNWNLAQILEHLATAMDYQVDGFPPELRFRRPVQRLARLLVKKRILAGGMRPGFQLKGSAAAALIKEQSEVEVRRRSSTCAARPRGSRRRKTAPTTAGSSRRAKPKLSCSTAATRNCI